MGTHRYVCLTSSVQEIIQTVCNYFESLRKHRFIAKAQSSYLNTVKEVLEGDQPVIILDFVENYSFHTSLIYYKSAVQYSSLCVIIHDTTTVHAFVTTVIS